MNLNRKIITGFLAASAVMFGVAHAQGPGCGPDGGPGMKRSSMQRGGMMDPGARVEQRLTRLKGDIKPTAQQEPLWQAFAEKSKAEADKGMQAMRERMQGDKSLSAPERLAQMQTLMKDRVTAMESVNESFNRLYAALTPEQKAAADNHFSAAGRHQHGPGRGAPRGAPGAAEPRKG
ncbi:MAG: Spy/CpxP family protein refolding chaperone [Betaproteobacteria bacterium]|nr:Spy/CpxP family protein refolding chaperone [Betaproteobacteria bacterium]